MDNKRFTADMKPDFMATEQNEYNEEEDSSSFDQDQIEAVAEPTFDPTSSNGTTTN